MKRIVVSLKIMNCKKKEKNYKQIKSDEYYTCIWKLNTKKERRIFQNNTCSWLQKSSEKKLNDRWDSIPCIYVFVCIFE